MLPFSVAMICCQAEWADPWNLVSSQKTISDYDTFYRVWSTDLISIRSDLQHIFIKYTHMTVEVIETINQRLCTVLTGQGNARTLDWCVPKSFPSHCSWAVNQQILAGSNCTSITSWSIKPSLSSTFLLSDRSLCFLDIVLWSIFHQPCLSICFLCKDRDLTAC